MSEKNYHFNDVSLLVTHYNRSHSLQHLLQSFQHIGCTFGEIVVSDDGSKPEHLDYVKSLRHQFGFRLVTTPLNKGLGNNINKGQDAVTLPYTLYVQEDFEPAFHFGMHFQNALHIMNEKQDTDMMRFYAYFKYPYLEPYKHGFSQMCFSPWLPGYQKFYSYSDHPHLRRSNFFDKFGRYAEGVKGDVTEYRMMMSFLKKKGNAMFYEDYKELFFQKNTAAEPSTMKRDFWRESNNLLVHQLREVYRYVKFNYDLLLGA